jgi:hypothetical protein
LWAIKIKGHLWSGLGGVLWDLEILNFFLLKLHLATTCLYSILFAQKSYRSITVF